ncbi:hypothetical protein M8J76_006109 [Diaphorina citri]|nr:hypothetical protein M8J76_006109 [Diaphorina citri]
MTPIGSWLTFPISPVIPGDKKPAAPNWETCRSNRAICVSIPSALVLAEGPATLEPAFPRANVRVLWKGSQVGSLFGKGERSHDFSLGKLSHPVFWTFGFRLPLTFGLPTIIGCLQSRATPVAPESCDTPSRFYPNFSTTH